MKHAVIIAESEKGKFEQVKDVEMPDGSTVCLAEQEYTRKELAAFNAEAGKWIVRRRGGCTFYASSDSGEDAYGSYCAYLDLVPERAVFKDGRFAGLYLYESWVRESGNSRNSFDVVDWGYPGHSIFAFFYGSYDLHLFLFEDAESLGPWREFTLMERDPDAEYESYLDF